MVPPLSQSAGHRSVPRSNEEPANSPEHLSGTLPYEGGLTHSVNAADVCEEPVDNFANASFPPDLIAIMRNALDGAISTLPHPLSSSHVRSLAETILRTANEGERDPTTLQTMALLELQISPREK
jgi:hypothetical protein